MTRENETIQYLSFNEIGDDRTGDLLSWCLMTSSFILLQNGNWDRDTNIITGQCSLFGINDLELTVYINPSESIAVKVNIKKAGDVVISGLEWVPLKNIDISFRIPKAETEGPQGTITASSDLIQDQLTGQLEKIGDNFFSPTDVQYI